MDKIRIPYNNEGYRIQADSLCDQGYTYAFFLRDECLTKEYTSMGFSPFNACVFSLFITLHNKFHEVHLNNLFMSANFSHLS